ncbi:hypothetical protein [Mycoplasmoides alvi]|uniref:hypothetical protein n=1 Tax=Mycoplasmoides alvi TaxID=78580 RepID=UPI00051B7768|nr:hypothetical protein [Mycoplasmoides alvi]
MKLVSNTHTHTHKANNKKFKKWIWFSFIVISFFSFTNLLTSCSTDTETNISKNNNTYTNPCENIDINGKSKIYESRANNENLMQDAIQKAKETNNVIFYSINWWAVLHKYGFISHLLKILEINNNKEIYIFSNGQQVNESLLSPILNDKNKFPNVHFIKIQWNDWSTFKFHYKEMEPIINDVLSRNKVIDSYFDDYALLKPLSFYLDKYNQYKDQTIPESELNNINSLIYENYKILFNTRSINLIADGTASWDFYDPKYYNFLNDFKIGYDNENQCFPLLNYTRDEISKSFNDSYWNTELKDKKNSGGILLFSLISSFKKINNIQQCKYFVAGTNTLLDLNETKTNQYPSTMIPDYIIQKGFWDPYYSINSKIISLYNSFNLDTKKLFLSILNINEQSKEILKNKKSIIYSGVLMENDNLLLSECQRIIKLYNIHKDANKTTQIVYKAHPRENNNYQESIKKKLKEIEPTFDVENSISFLDKSVPMEYFVMEGFTKSDPSINSDVIYYSGFSTTVYLLDGDNLANTIYQVIVSNDNFNLIRKWNGYPSRVFPNNKIITNDLLFNDK